MAEEASTPVEVKPETYHDLDDSLAKTTSDESFSDMLTFTDRSHWEFCAFSSFLVLIAFPAYFALIFYVAAVIFNNTGDLGGTEAFVFTVGWLFMGATPFFYAILFSKLFSCKLFSEDKVTCGKFLVWDHPFIFFACVLIVAFIVSVVGAVRLVPYLVLHNQIAEINYDSTPKFKDAQMFMWSDAKISEDYLVSSIGYARGQLCASCGKNCQRCEPVNVTVKYCASPIILEGGVIKSNSSDNFPPPSGKPITQINGVAVCYWFPCRTRVSWDMSGGIYVSDDPDDRDCYTNPSTSMCSKLCSRNIPLRIFNGVELTTGKSWGSKNKQGVSFRGGSSIRAKYDIYVGDIATLFEDNLIPTLETNVGVPVLRQSDGQYLKILWGDQPITYYSSGLGVFIGITWAAFLVFFPPSPVFFPFLPNNYHRIAWGIVWVILAVVPYSLYYVYFPVPSETV